MDKLTNTQSVIFGFIQGFVAREGYPPTRREIADAMGYSSANAAEDALRSIERKGWISIAPGISRGIRILA